MSEPNVIGIGASAQTYDGYKRSGLGSTFSRLLRSGSNLGPAPTDRRDSRGSELDRGLARIVRVTSGFLFLAALFTLSWERFGNIAAGPYNIKLPVILFLLVGIMTAPTWLRRGIKVLRVRENPPIAFVLFVAILLIAYLLVRAVLAPSLGHGIAAVVSMLTGAVLPALAVAGVVRSRADLGWACAWIVRGAVFASLFGLYQLLAFYVGLPQIVGYRGVGTDGSTGRIAAFSYEPAYFAYFLVIAIGALVTRRLVLHSGVSWLWVGFFGIMLALVNVRALMFLLPVLALLLAFGWRMNRRLLLRGAVAAILITIVSLGLPAVIAASAPSAQHPIAKSSVPGSASSAAAASGAPGSSVSTDPLQPPNPSAVLDPNEATSNAPRLELYKAVLAIDLRNPVFGVGPGQLADAIGSAVPTTPGVAVVANNIWLQAGADGGALSVLLEAAFVVGIAIVWFRNRRRADQALSSAWLAVILVAGMLTSYFFDLKMWVAAALILVGVGTTVTSRGGEPGGSAGRSVNQ